MVVGEGGISAVLVVLAGRWMVAGGGLSTMTGVGGSVARGYVLVGCCRCGLGRRRRRLAGLLLSLTARAGWLVGWSALLSEYVISIFTWLRCWLILHSGCPSKSKPWMALTNVVGSCRLDELITRLFVCK